MEGEVLIRVKGIQTDPEGERSEVTVTVRGEKRERNGALFLLYEEYPEEGGKAAKTCVKYRDGSLEVTRLGAIASRMVFEEGRRYAAPYRTDLGALQMEYCTSKVWKTEREGFLELGAQYSLTINGEFSAFCEIRLQCRQTEQGPAQPNPML